MHIILVYSGGGTDKSPSVYGTISIKTGGYQHELQL